MPCHTCPTLFGALPFGWEAELLGGPKLSLPITLRRLLDGQAISVANHSLSSYTHGHVARVELLHESCHAVFRTPISMRLSGSWVVKQENEPKVA